jgi:hypothetical protein
MLSPRFRLSFCSIIVCFTTLLVAQPEHERLSRPLPDFDIRWLTEARLEGPRAPFSERRRPARVAGAATPLATAQRYLWENRGLWDLNGDEISRFKLLRQDTREGVTWLDFQQTISGIPAFESHIKVTIGADGDVISLTEPSCASRSARSLRSESAGGRRRPGSSWPRW